MKNVMKKMHNVMSHFTIVDIGILKLCLLSLGIILGAIFVRFFGDILVALWVIFILSWLYIVIKVFGFYWSKA